MRGRRIFGALILGAGIAGGTGCGEEDLVDPDGGSGAADARAGSDAGSADSGGLDADLPVAPAVISTAPQDGAERVLPSVAITITFSVPMRSAGAVRLGSGASEAAVEARVEGAVLTVRPVSPLAPRTEWTLRVEEAQSVQGGVLAEALELRFTTGGTEAVPPRLGELRTTVLDCRDRYVLPPEIEGPDGLGAFGWTFDVLHVPIAWTFANRGVMPWISDNSLTVPSARIDVERTPETGQCFVDELRSGLDQDLAAVLRAQSAFHDPSVGLDTLSVADYAAPTYPDDELNFPLTSAVWGLFAGVTPVEGAPEVEWDEALRASLEGIEAAYPSALAAALADFVHAVGEAHILRESAAGSVGSARWAQMARRIVPRAYERSDLLWLEPVTVLPDLSSRPGGGMELIELLELSDLNRAAQRVAGAADALLTAAIASGPFAGPDLDVLTPLGRFVVRPSARDDDGAPDDAALILDLGGDDAYPGRVASTHLDHLAASVLIDVSGADEYGPQDWSLRSTEDRSAVFANADGLTQGAGLFGVGLSIDAAGADVYRSTVFGQGIGLFGVGILDDREGEDIYDATYFGQGTGQVGVGLLLDRRGDDTYTLGSQGQGVGRPRGQGVLLDAEGDDDYLALHDDDPPELLEKYPVWFGSGYRDENRVVELNGELVGEEHNMSVAMGVGWGFRGDWFTDETNWAGGFGAAIDLGDGNDVRFADAMSMGQGFVYGMGLLYDDGGDDVYRAFWWSFGSGTHMGTGLMIENGGDDDLTIGQFSAALGHDTGVSWYLDLGGSDLYAGQMTYGRALDHGLAFFVEEGGDDIYEGTRGVNHGVCDINPEVPLDGLERLGLFMDLGGGADAYLTPNPAAANDTAWYQDPHRGGDPTEKRGIGLDR